jgi:hypothetical protein
MMKILTVEYRELRTGSGYNNTTVGAVAEVELGQPPEAVLSDLREWVAGQFGAAEQRADLKQTIRDLEWQHDNAQRKVDLVDRKWKAYVAFLEKLGIERPDEIPDTLENLPF